MARGGRAWAWLIAPLLAICSAEAAQAQCRQALALALDVSGSVDETEYRLQLNGLASALLDPTVQEALLASPSAPVRLMIYEWSGLNDQYRITDWTEITGFEDLITLSETLLAHQRVTAAHTDTGLSAAILYGARALNTQADCWQKTLDVSGDGPGNIGQHPMDLPQQELGNIIVNGLIIGPNNPANVNKNRQNLKTLEEYYQAFVLRGATAFTEPASDYNDFQRAMTRKLIRELQPAAVSFLTKPPADPEYEHQSDP